MLYMIGIGLTGDITCTAKSVLKDIEEVYMESYTMPWNYEKIEKKISNELGKEITLLNREKVESKFLIERAKKKDVALLIGGDVFSATTHFSLYADAVNNSIPVRVLHNSSIFSAIAKTGLSIYKFGETVTLSFWRENYKPISPINKIKRNYDDKLHTLVLLDIDKELGFMDVNYALSLLDKMQKDIGYFFIKELVVLSRIGFKDEKITYSSFNKLLGFSSDALGKPPFSLVIPSHPNEIEREFLSIFSL